MNFRSFGDIEWDMGSGICSVLLEWDEILQRLFVIRDETRFAQLEKLMEHLIDLRTQLMSGLLNTQQVLLITTKTRDFGFRKKRNFLAKMRNKLEKPKQIHLPFSFTLPKVLKYLKVSKSQATVLISCI